MFDMTAQVIAVKEGSDNWPLFTGTFEDVCDFMASEYQTGKYDKIVLAGPYASVVEDRTRAYAMTNYNNGIDMKIEVIE
jgi:hypothetical protein